MQDVHSVGIHTDTIELLLGVYLGLPKLCLKRVQFVDVEVQDVLNPVLTPLNYFWVFT